MADITVTCPIQKAFFFWRNLSKIEEIIWAEISKINTETGIQAVAENDFLVSLQPKVIIWSLNTKKKKTYYDAKIAIQTSDTYPLEETLLSIRKKLLEHWPKLRIELPDIRYMGWQATHYSPIT